MLGENSIQSFLHCPDCYTHSQTGREHTHMHTHTLTGCWLQGKTSLQVQQQACFICCFFNLWFHCKINVWLIKSIKQSWVSFSWVISRFFLMLCDCYFWSQLFLLSLRSCSSVMVDDISAIKGGFGVTPPRLRPHRVDHEVRGRKCSHTRREHCESSF